jgi:hypothetical protein
MPEVWIGLQTKRKYRDKVRISPNAAGRNLTPSGATP